jgi:hypothetical protein
MLSFYYIKHVFLLNNKLHRQLGWCELVRISEIHTESEKTTSEVSLTLRIRVLSVGWVST